MLGKHKHYEKCNLLIDKSVDGVNRPHGTVPASIKNKRTTNDGEEIAKHKIQPHIDRESR